MRTGGRPVDTGMLTRLQATTKAFWTSFVKTTSDPAFQSDFMPPGDPPPVYEKVEVRTTDYDPYTNIKWTIPPGRGGLTMQNLRDLADNCEVLRIVLENCKKQLSTLRYDFHLREMEGKTPDELKELTKNSENIKKCKEYFKKPDGRNSFRSWVKLVSEETLVLDHLCILNQKNLLGEPLRARVIDGVTIVKRIDANGETPEPPSVAYQQVLKGVVTADLTTDDMLVYHSNPRVSKDWGFGPVEQIAHIVNIALRRSNFQLNYYTEGNIPDMLIRVSAQWSDEQIAKYQKYFDMLLAGDLARRRKIRFIPESLDPIQPQKDTLKDEFDEWLARVICYCFGVSANPFIRNLNRATGEQSREQSDEEGMFARMETLKEIVDTIIVDWLGIDDVEFMWIQNKSQDSLKQAQIDEIHVQNGIKSRDEVRSTLGLPPIGIGCTQTVSSGVVGLSDGQKDDHVVEPKPSPFGDSGKPSPSPKQPTDNPQK